MHARGRPGEQVGLRHVARAIPEEGDGESGEFTTVLADRQQVGQQLAGVEVVAQRVDDRHRGARGHLDQAGLRVGAPDDRGDLALEHAGGVGGGLLAAELAVGGGDDERRPRRDRRCRRRTRRGCGSRTCRRSRRRSADRPAGFTDQRSFLSSTARSRIALCSARVRSSSRRKWRVMRICRGHGGAPRKRRASRTAVRNSAISASPMMRGGARRMLVSLGALMMRPRCRAAAATTARGDGFGQPDADEQPLAAHLGVHRGDPMRSMIAARNSAAPAGRVGDEARALDLGEHGIRRGGRQRVAAEGAAVLSGGEEVARGTVRDERADRDSPADALGHGDRIRHDPVRAGRRTSGRCGRRRSGSRR